MRFRRHQEAAQASTRRIVVLFVFALVGLVLAVNGVLALAYWATMPFAHGYPALFFETNTGMVLLFVLGGCWFETARLREGGAHVARMAGARPAQVSGHAPAERLERRFANIVREMALASRQTPPAAWVMPRDDAINAFAAGWSADDAVIAVTRGALERLTREELQGVVAHEMSHIVHGDARLNMRLIGLVWGLQMIFGLGQMLAAADDEGRRPASLLFGWALMAVGSLGWLAGRLMQAAVSRQREFLADASAVQYTRLVDGIGGALRKIGGQAGDELRATRAVSLAHLMLSQPSRWAGWTATHPPLAQRLQRLYGRDPGPMPADPLPSPPDEPLVALVPAPFEARRENVQALQHDPLQQAALQGVAADEAEALQRIALWHGPGEREAALVALVAQTRSPAQWNAWATAVAHVRVAGAVRREIEKLGPAAQQHVFERLARAEAAAPRQRRLAVLRTAKQRVGTPTDALRWLALRHVLRARAPALIASGPASSLAALNADVAAVGAWLRRPNDAPPARQAWRAAVRLQRRLGSMQRPLLLRQWRDAGATAEMLWALALLLDLPPPAQ